MDSIGVHRPRNVDWQRAAALLYGDWGTSKAYVIGAAFLAAKHASFPIILAVCALTGLVGYNYIVVCKHFPDGGGAYSSARLQSRFLAGRGSLLLVAGVAPRGGGCAHHFAGPAAPDAGLPGTVTHELGQELEGVRRSHPCVERR